MIRAAATLLLLCICPLSAGQTETRVVKPEVRVGDSWTYRSTNVFAPGTHDIENRVSFTNDKVILVVTTSKGDGKEVDSAWTSDWNIVTSHGGMMFRPDSGVFRFPLRIGAKHDVKYELFRPRENVSESSATGSVTVVGWGQSKFPQASSAQSG